MQTQNKTRELTLVALFSALNIASRVYMQALPNVKPVTTIIMLCVLYFGVKFALKVTVTTTLISNLLLGFGICTIFQILAWSVIVFVTYGVNRLFRTRNIVLFAGISGLMGFLFGVIVSLEKLVLMGWTGYIVYWISGLGFDALHAVGNVVFYFVCAPIMGKLFQEHAKTFQMNTPSFQGGYGLRGAL